MGRLFRGFAAGLLYKIVVLHMLAAGPADAQTAQNVLIVVNDSSPLSRSIGGYYARQRAVPARNVCRIHTTTQEDIARTKYNTQIAAPIARCLKDAGLIESVLYIVTTAGVPLRIPGTGGLEGDAAAVDSELTLLYSDITTGSPHPTPGSLSNPFFSESEARFAHPKFPIYLVTRLAAYDLEGAKAIIDRALKAKNRGKFVLDMAGAGPESGESWIRRAAASLPQDRVILDESPTVVYDQKDVIGYASWGSNDGSRHRRFVGFEWLPGAIVTEFVSTNGRTFARPSEAWSISDWQSPWLWFVGSPQTLTADYLLEGATGASGHVYEPYLMLTPRPDLLLPAYYRGRNLAESYYISIPHLSWQNIVVGDPLCSLGTP